MEQAGMLAPFFWDMIRVSKVVDIIKNKQHLLHT